MNKKYVVHNATAFDTKLEQFLSKYGIQSDGNSNQGDAVMFSGDASVLQKVIKFLQSVDDNGNAYITGNGVLVYDPHREGDTNEPSPNRNKRLGIESRKSMSEATPEERRAVIRKAQGKIDYKVGDSVVITLDGLQKHSRSTPASMGYSQATIDWRTKLSKLRTDGTVGTIERVFPGGNNLNVDFDGYLTQVPSYMVEPAAGNSGTKMTTETYRNKKYNAMLRLMEKYENEMTTEYEMSRDERGAFLETLRGYQNYGNIIYRTNELAKAVDEIAQLIETAGNFTLKETDGWFDNVTANRHTKQMKEALKILQTEAKEIMQRQQRLEAAYEDIGQLLGRYYDI